MVMTSAAGAGAGRRRSPQAAPRPRLVKFFLTEEELAQLDEAAGQAGLARGASAAGLVRRVGTNLNQAVARLNATGQRGDDLLPAAQLCVRVIRRLDEAAEH